MSDDGPEPAKDRISTVRVLETFIGTAIGAAVALVSFYVQASFDEAARVQAWFDETYIAKGVDTVASYVTQLRVHVQEPSVSLGLDKEFPRSALARLETITGTTTYSDAAVEAFVNSLSAGHEDSEGVVDALRLVTDNLARLREALLAQEVREKRRVYALRRMGTVRGVMCDMEQVLTRMRSNTRQDPEASKVCDN